MVRYYYIFMIGYLLLGGCAKPSITRVQEQANITPVQVQLIQPNPKKITGKQRKELRLYLSTFYRGRKKKEWQLARQKILQMGPEGTEALCIFMIKFFSGGKKYVAWKSRRTDATKYWEDAVQELSIIGPPAIPYVIYAMAHRGAGNTGRMLCSRTLVNIGKPAVQPLINNLQRGSKRFRRTVLETLSEIGEIKAVPAIVNLYQSLPRPKKTTDDISEDPFFDLRFYCIKALGKLRSEQGLPSIARALDDPSQMVVQQGIESLLLFNSPKALPILQKALKITERYFTGYRPKLKRKIAWIEYNM